MYSPTTSRTLAMRIRRQLERLRDVVLQPNVRQMRPTMVWLMPVALAMVRVLQRVSPFGVVSIPFFGLESSPLRILPQLLATPGLSVPDGRPGRC